MIVNLVLQFGGELAKGSFLGLSLNFTIHTNLCLFNATENKLHDDLLSAQIRNSKICSSQNGPN